MSELIGRMQSQIKRTSGDLFLFTLKLISGAVLGLTFALVMQEMLGHQEGTELLSFFFVIVVGTAAFLKIAKRWSFTSVLVFDLICVLLGLVLRLYIMLAPGA